ncbi:hypothetical protein LRS06_02100 [Hymenobacter sp. J193]|uniref:reverse transcriptase domain-containing protein n=1 Tax=Hymenobacter sp. J193 TaxID=2898429 RepID=UPI002150D062|nr:reverse transcriptase domain-containing protein [Hymenobacter sp. J193]MCR5886583.1 hypothetical protein [Hymenobacter sp. J193]
MMSFESYFSRKEIIKCLVSARISESKKEEEIHFLRNISSEHEKMPELKMADFFPSRRAWVRPSAKERKGKSSSKIYEYSLLKTVFICLEKVNKGLIIAPEWLIKLFNKVEEIQKKSCINNVYFLKKPVIFPVLKDEVNQTYRPIALYDYVDKIIISRVAKYLTDVFDSDLHNCAVAFRSSKKKTVVDNTHHGTVSRIIQYQKEYGYKKLWAAECDIKKFFDCVNHNLAIEVLNEAIARASLNSIKVDERAINWYKAYLDSYSFNKYVKEQEIELSKRRRKKISFEWLGENEFYKLYPKEDVSICIGVPQGGAISCLIANLIMHNVDTSVLDGERDDMLYLRYCDDMIIVHSDQSSCQKALDRYYFALQKSKLIAHDPVNISAYNKDFWKQKSKAPYRWANPLLEAGSVPWLSFVGYQLRYDGYIRIRSKSVKSEMMKQIAVVDSVIKSVKFKKKKLAFDYSHVKISRRQIVYRVTNKLISMSVGRPQIGVKGEPQMCWSSGFKLLSNGNSFYNSIKRLDKNREKQIIRLNKALISLDVVTLHNNIKKDKIKYFGKPFSYIKSFNR